MKKTVFLTMMFGLMVVFSGSVSAQNKGNGKVFGVNKPGDANFNTFTYNNGDVIETTLYTPNNDQNKDLGLVKGMKYTMLMITQPNNNNAQASVYWAADTPDLQNKMLYKKTKIAGVGGTKTLMRGDTLTIQTQAAPGGGTDVTFSIFRNKKSVGVFSFVVK